MTVPVALKWANNELHILDQTKLPLEETYEALTSIEAVYDAIKKLKVRGAPLIGLTAAYGMAIATQQYTATTIEALHTKFTEHIDYLVSSRPTAVNLMWALNQIKQKGLATDSLKALQQVTLQEAIRLHEEDEARCKAIGQYALDVLHDKHNILTICNAGTIATAKYGTALAPFHLGIEQGKSFHVYACETRPVLQGARLTAWELQKAGVDVTLITDSMAAHTMATKQIDAVIVGADRIATNGDTANKIGTHGLAILAKSFNIPFYVAAPSSTFDFSIETGAAIPIEERASDEITHIAGKQVAPNGIDVFNPAFDVTPHAYITAIITEKGVFDADFINIQ
jgi:methylthioribose-1-phosphate isomerase